MRKLHVFLLLFLAIIKLIPLYAVDNSFDGETFHPLITINIKQEHSSDEEGGEGDYMGRTLVPSQIFGNEANEGAPNELLPNLFLSSDEETSGSDREKEPTKQAYKHLRTQSHKRKKDQPKHSTKKAKPSSQSEDESQSEGEKYQKYDHKAVKKYIVDQYNKKTSISGILTEDIIKALGYEDSKATRHNIRSLKSNFKKSLKGTKQDRGPQKEMTVNPVNQKLMIFFKQTKEPWEKMPKLYALFDRMHPKFLSSRYFKEHGGRVRNFLALKGVIGDNPTPRKSDQLKTVMEYLESHPKPIYDKFSEEHPDIPETYFNPVKNIFTDYCAIRKDLGPEAPKKGQKRSSSTAFQVKKKQPPAKRPKTTSQKKYRDYDSKEVNEYILGQWEKGITNLTNTGIIKALGYEHTEQTRHKIANLKYLLKPKNLDIAPQGVITPRQKLIAFFQETQEPWNILPNLYSLFNAKYPNTLVAEGFRHNGLYVRNFLAIKGVIPNLAKRKAPRSQVTIMKYLEKNPKGTFEECHKKHPKITKEYFNRIKGIAEDYEKILKTSPEEESESEQDGEENPSPKTQEFREDHDSFTGSSDESHILIDEDATDVEEEIISNQNIKEEAVDEREESPHRVDDGAFEKADFRKKTHLLNKISEKERPRRPTKRVRATSHSTEKTSRHPTKRAKLSPQVKSYREYDHTKVTQYLLKAWKKNKNPSNEDVVKALGYKNEPSIRRKITGLKYALKKRVEKTDPNCLPEKAVTKNQKLMNFFRTTKNPHLKIANLYSEFEKRYPGTLSFKYFKDQGSLVRNFLIKEGDIEDTSSRRESEQFTTVIDYIKSHPDHTFKKFTKKHPDIPESYFHPLKGIFVDYNLSEEE